MKKYLLMSIIVNLSLADIPLFETGIKNVFYKGDDATYQRGLERNLFRDDKLNVVIDEDTGLMWQDGNIVRGYSKLEDAIKYCSDTVFAGFNDWYLPTREELLSIVDYSKEFLLPNSSKIYSIFKNVEGKADSISYEVNSRDAQKFWSSTLVTPENEYEYEHEKAFIVSFKTGATEMVETLNLNLTRRTVYVTIIAWGIFFPEYNKPPAPPSYPVKCVRKVPDIENLNLSSKFEVNKNSNKRENFKAEGFNITIADRPKYGNVTLESDSFVYTPAKDYYGSDEFTLKLSNDSYEFNKTVKVKVMDSIEINSKTFEVKEGWNLLAIPTKEELANPNSYFNGNIYTFKDNKWSINPSILRYGEGFFVYADSNKEYSFIEDNYNLELNNLTNGWHLLGSGNAISDLSSNPNITQLYTYNNEYRWIENPPLIKAGEGFWIKIINDKNDKFEWMSEAIFSSEEDCKAVATTYDSQYKYDVLGQCHMSWFEAKKYCQDQGGRLPTIRELTSAMNSDIANEFIISDIGINNYYYWTSDERQVSFEFKNGDFDIFNKDDLVRCVK